MRQSPITCTTLAAALTGIIALIGSASAQIINEDLKLLANDGGAGDWFGWDVAIHGDVVVVGANRDNDNGVNSGSAYLFDVATGTQIRKLLPSDGVFDDNFGWSVAIENGTVAVGAPQDGDNGFRSGSAYLFDASTGNQLFKLLSSDGVTEDKFGYCIAMNNGIVAVGAPYDIGGEPGSAYLFDASTGNQLHILLPDDNPARAQFGISIAIDNGIVAVGAYLDNANGAHSGSAYLFDASTGDQLFKLLPDDGVAEDYFGWSIAIENNMVAVGARQDGDNGVLSGSAYLFDATTGNQVAKLLPSDGAANAQFGSSISIDNGIVAVGAAHDDDNGANSGSAYLFDATTGAQMAKLLPTDGTAADVFGQSIAIANNIIVVGTLLDDDNGSDSGSAYLFSTSTGIHLALTSSCPNSGPLQITWTNATPNGSAALLYARNTGSFVIPNNRPCSGTILGLGTNQLQVVFTGPSNSNGDRTLNASASAGACGGRLQLLDLTTCDTSNVTTIQ